MIASLVSNAAFQVLGTACVRSQEVIDPSGKLVVGTVRPLLVTKAEANVILDESGAVEAVQLEGRAWRSPD